MLKINAFTDQEGERFKEMKNEKEIRLQFERHRS